MKFESITVENYRQFEEAKLTFDDDITILAGANNSGKTSLINLIKKLFVDEKIEYSISDIPAENMQEWLDSIYSIFEDFFANGKSINEVDTELVDSIIPRDSTQNKTLMKTTSVKIHVSYNPELDDIKLFVDYIMDLDENKHDFYFIYTFELIRSRWVKIIMSNFTKIQRRFKEIIEDKETLTDSTIKTNIVVKERYLKQLIVDLYVQSMVPIGYYCDKEYNNKCKFKELKEFRKLFNLCFIKASRPLDDDESDHSHMLSKQMIKMAKLDDSWNELIVRLPDELLKPIQEKEIDKVVRDTSLKSLKDTIAALEQTNGGKSGELMLDMQVTEDDISELLQRITTAAYNINGYYLGEASQGLGYSNLIYIHLQLKEYEKNNDTDKVNMFLLEEPESHMHPQMQQVFLKYLMDHYQTNTLQGLITTHSNEMVRVAGLSHLRVIRHIKNFKSKLYDLSTLLKELKDDDKKSSDKKESNKLENFYDWFFEIGYSELIFADKAIFYEGDTERLFIRKAMSLKEYQKLKQQYIAFVQVGGAYAKNYEKLIKFLEIKSLIITDIDYDKDKIEISDVNNSSITNATIKHFYAIDYPSKNPVVNDFYKWKKTGENIVDDLIYISYQTEQDGYARTLEEAMLNKFYKMKVDETCNKNEWKLKRKESKLKFSIPNRNADEEISVRDIVASTSENKTDFMYSVIMNQYVEKMMPNYIDGGLKWLME